MTLKKLLSLLLVNLLILMMVQMAFAGAVRNTKEFQIYNKDSQMYTIKIKFGVGYAGKKKVNNVDITVWNKTDGLDLTVISGKVKMATSRDETNSKNLNKSVKSKKSMSKTHIVKNKTQSYTYKDVIVEVKMDLGAATYKYFVFWPGSNNKAIEVFDTPY